MASVARMRVLLDLLTVRFLLSYRHAPDAGVRHGRPAEPALGAALGLYLGHVALNRAAGVSASGRCSCWRCRLSS